MNTILKWLFIFVSVIFVPYILLRFFYPAYFRSSWYKSIIIFGKKGSGKTTHMMREIIRAYRNGNPVYCNFEMPFSNKYDIADFGVKQFPPNSLVLIDEAATTYDNRNFKNFDKRITEYLRMSRHHKVRLIWYSQSWDLDKKIRDLADELYTIHKFFGVFTVLKRINKFLTVDTGNGNKGSNSSEGGQIVERYEYEFFLFPGARIWLFIPRWSVFFDSFEVYNVLDPIPSYYVEPSEYQLLMENRKSYRRIRNARYRFRVLSFLAGIVYNTKEAIKSFIHFTIQKLKFRFYYKNKIFKRWKEYYDDEEFNWDRNDYEVDYEVQEKKKFIMEGLNNPDEVIANYKAFLEWEKEFEDKEAFTYQTHQEAEDVKKHKFYDTVIH